MKFRWVFFTQYHVWTEFQVQLNKPTNYVLLHPRLLITILDLLNLDLENKTQLPHILYLTLTRFSEWKISNDIILQCFGPKCFVLFRFIWFVSMQCHSKRSLLKQVKKSTIHLFVSKSLSKGIVGLDLRFGKTHFFSVFAFKIQLIIH